MKEKTLDKAHSLLLEIPTFFSERENKERALKAERRAIEHCIKSGKPLTYEQASNVSKIILLSTRVNICPYDLMMIYQEAVLYRRDSDG